MSPRKNEKAKYPGRPVEHYLTFKKQSDQAKYHGKNKIPIETFYELYFDGDVEFKNRESEEYSNVEGVSRINVDSENLDRWRVFEQ